jgi:hypothetical protein
MVLVEQPAFNDLADSAANLLLSMRRLFQRDFYGNGIDAIRTFFAVVGGLQIFFSFYLSFFCT